MHVSTVAYFLACCVVTLREPRSNYAVCFYQIAHPSTKSACFLGFTIGQAKQMNTSIGHLSTDTLAKIVNFVVVVVKAKHEIRNIAENWAGIEANPRSLCSTGQTTSITELL